MDPRVARAHYYLGTSDLLEQGQARIDSAIAELRAELEVAPGEPMTSLFLGIALVETRQAEEALPHLEAATRLPRTRTDAYRFLGRSLLDLGRREEAIAALSRGLLSAEAEGVSGSGELAEFEARQVSSLHYQLAQALRDSGRGAEAEPHFAAAKRFQARSSESARESLDRYLASEVGSAAFEREEGAAAVSEATGEEIAEIRRSISTAVARAYLNLGVIESRERRFREAIPLLEEGASLEPELPQIQYSLGAARFAAGRFGEAAPALERALAAAPGSPEIRRMLALAWLNAEEWGKAAELLAADPARGSSPELQYAYGLALVRSGRAADAEPVFSELLSASDRWPALDVVVGQAYAQQGDFEAAIAMLQRALALDPNAAGAHSTLGEIHLRRGELAAAEAELEAELAAHPQDDRAAYTLATVLELHQKPEEAAELLESILGRQPRLAKARYLLGKILLGSGEVEDATEQLEAAAGLAPGDAMVHYQLGLAYRELGRSEDSERAFEIYRALKSDQEKSPG
jgi:tetratricopeptide (TPR) repeat protein